MEEGCFLGTWEHREGASLSISDLLLKTEVSSHTPALLAKSETQWNQALSLTAGFHCFFLRERLGGQQLCPSTEHKQVSRKHPQGISCSLYYERMWFGSARTTATNKADEIQSNGVANWLGFVLSSYLLVFPAVSAQANSCSCYTGCSHLMFCYQMGVEEWYQWPVVS